MTTMMMITIQSGCECLRTVPNIVCKINQRNAESYGGTPRGQFICRQNPLQGWGAVQKSLSTIMRFARAIVLLLGPLMLMGCSITRSQPHAGRATSE